MKKMIAILIAAAMVMPMAAYGAEADEESEDSGGGLREAFSDFMDEANDTISESIGYEGVDNDGEEDEDAKALEGADLSYEELLDSLQEEFEDTVGRLTDDLDEVFGDVGDTYEDYLNNESRISEWYDNCIDSEEELFGLAYLYSAYYYMDLAAVFGEEDDKAALMEALDDYYEVILDDAFGSFYEEIINGAIKSVRDTYYVDIITDNDSDRVGDAEEFYADWMDAFSETYQSWSDTFTELYTDWSEIWSGFMNDDDVDVDEIFADDGNAEADIDED